MSTVVDTYQTRWAYLPVLSASGDQADRKEGAEQADEPNVKGHVSSRTEQLATAPAAYPPNGGVSRAHFEVPPVVAGLDRAEKFAVILGVLAFSVLAGLIAVGTELSAPWWAVLALAAIAFYAEREAVHITNHTQVSIASLPLLFAAVVFGPLEAMVVGASALLADLRPPFLRWLVWTEARVLGAGLAGVGAVAALGSDSSTERLLLAVLVSAATLAAHDTLVVAITAAVRGNGAFRDTALTVGRFFLATLPIQAAAVALLAYTAQAISPWTTIIFLLPALGCQRLLSLYQTQRQLADDLIGANRKLEAANVSFASGLVAALDARDHYTAGHSAAVAVYARDIAEELGLDETDKQRAHLAGLLHDVGKVGLPAGLLEKPGALTAWERRQMEVHAEIGERILRKVSDYRDIAEIVRHHHERFDGTGYPDKLAGDRIPIVSRIISVADAYNAMTSGRPYRAALSTHEARRRLREGEGTQFDPQVVAAFEKRLIGSLEPYRLGVHSDFALEAQWAPATAVA